MKGNTIVSKVYVNGVDRTDHFIGLPGWSFNNANLAEEGLDWSFIVITLEEPKPPDNVVYKCGDCSEFDTENMNVCTKTLKKTSKDEWVPKWCPFQGKTIVWNKGSD